MVAMYITSIAGSDNQVWIVLKEKKKQTKKTQNKQTLALNQWTN